MFELVAAVTPAEIMAHERIVLQTLKFDLVVAHPHRFLLDLVASLPGEKDRLNEVLQMAWAFVNDSYATPLCLLHQPRHVAVAMLNLAVRTLEKDDKLGIEKPAKEWWLSAGGTGISMKVINGIHSITRYHC